MDAQHEALQDFLEILQEHRKICEALGKYTEAEIAKKRMDELKAHDEQRRREAVRSRQLAEQLAVEEAHMLEFQKFNELWDTKMQAFEQNAQALMDAMRVRHADELREFQQKLIAKALQPRHTSEYLNLREVQEKLAHQRNYAAAAKIKEKADELMAWEEEKWTNERQAEMLRKEEEYKRKLGQEAETMRKRIAQQRAEQNRNRQVALEKLLQRYHNVKKELETAHKVERSKLDREIALAAKREAVNASSGRKAPAPKHTGSGSPSKAQSRSASQPPSSRTGTVRAGKSPYEA